MGRKRANEEFDYLRSLRGQWAIKQAEAIRKTGNQLAGPCTEIEELDEAIKIDDQYTLLNCVKIYTTSDEWQRLRSAWRQHRRRAKV